MGTQFSLCLSKMGQGVGKRLASRNEQSPHMSCVNLANWEKIEKLLVAGVKWHLGCQLATGSCLGVLDPDAQ